MVKVPEYGGLQVSDRAVNQQHVNVRPSAEAFGAGVGRGMQSLGQGLSQASDAMTRLKDYQGSLQAKDELTAFEREKLELDYGQNGFLNTSGSNAAGGYGEYTKKLDALKQKYGKNLTGRAADQFNTAANEVVTSGMRTGIAHAARGTKEWAAMSAEGRLASLADQALAAYDRPGEVQKFIAASFAEINEYGQAQGWPAETLDMKKKAAASQIHTNVALAMASKPNGAGSALKYLKDNSALMDTKTRMKLETDLKPYADEEAALGVWNEMSRAGRGSAEPAQAEPAAAGAGGRTVGQSGPSSARASLLRRAAATGKGADHIDGLDEAFATNLAAWMDDAPPDIRDGLEILSGHRSEERQRQLWNEALQKYGSPAAARKWVAPPGKSNHNHGKAVDIRYKGGALSSAPKHVQDWVAKSLGQYGLHRPMGHEPWHIEPTGSRGGSTVAASASQPVARAQGPSYDQIMARADQISDPSQRDAFLKIAERDMTMRSKAETANAQAAKSQLWEMSLTGVPMSQVPLEVKLAAGHEMVAAMERRETEGDKASDPILMHNMRIFAEQNPREFAAMDLLTEDIFGRLSAADFKSLSEKQASAVSALRDGSTDQTTKITQVFSKAETQLKAVGLGQGMGGKDEEAKAQVNRQRAAFLDALAREVEAAEKAKGAKLDEIEQQKLINRMLLPMVMKTEEPGWLWGTNTVETKGFAFEFGGMDGVSLDISVDQIPPADLIQIKQTLRAQYDGREPSDEEVQAFYARFLQSKYGAGQ